MCRINGDKTVVKYIEHFGLGSLRRHWSVRPGQRVDDGVGAGGVLVSNSNPS